MRAQPRRGPSGIKSKWLREDGGAEGWRSAGKENQYATNQEFQNANFSRATDGTRFQENIDADLADKTGSTKVQTNQIKSRDNYQVTSNNNGLDSDELYGLNMEERKRQRSEAHVTISQIKQTIVSPMDSTLSNDDCVETSSDFLAKLAEQASHPQ